MFLHWGGGKTAASLFSPRVIHVRGRSQGGLTFDCPQGIQHFSERYDQAIVKKTRLARSGGSTPGVVPFLIGINGPELPILGGHTLLRDACHIDRGNTFRCEHPRPQEG